MPCDLLRAESESDFESLFESPSKANTYGIVGWLGDAVKIKVMAPPEKGRTNEAVVSLLAEKLGLPTDAVSVVSGHSSASKVITINGMDDEAIKNALG